MDRSKLAGLPRLALAGVTGPVVPANPQRRRFKSDTIRRKHFSEPFSCREDKSLSEKSLFAMSSGIEDTVRRSLGCNRSHAAVALLLIQSRRSELALASASVQRLRLEAIPAGEELGRGGAELP
jgi:hypothetical protein